MRIAALALLTCVLLLSCSTVGNLPHRTDTVPAKAIPGQSPAERPQATIEITDTYSLGIVEFDDQGRYWNRRDNQADTT